MLLKSLVPVLVLCLVNSSQGAPSANYLTEGRGIGSTLWGWISYPFSWWSSSEPEIPPVNDQLIGSPYTPYDNVEIAKRNVTVWCNDQTCTTVKCDKFGCKNITCNIYDTDMRGECREYNTELKPEEPVPPKSEEGSTSPTLQDKVTETSQPSQTSSVPIITMSSTQASVQTEERPLELEAVLSSTVTEEIPEKQFPVFKENKSSSPINKANTKQRSYYSYLIEIDNVLSHHMLTMLKNYATKLTNKLITNLDLDTFCADGVCYYTKCEGYSCETQYCKHDLFKGETKCSTKKSTGMYQFDLKSNKIVPLSDHMDDKSQIKATNTEENDLNLLNKILNK